MTDPIADFLTRIRNGIQAAHETVDIPASKLKREMARILTEQGYINGFEIEAPTEDHPGEILRVELKYTDDRRSAISGLRRVSRPGQRRYVTARRDPEGPGRPRHRRPLDVQGRHDRSRRAPREGRRRGRGGGLVAPCPASAASPSPCPPR